MAYNTNSVELDMVNEVLYNTGESLVNSLEGGPNISQIRFALKQEKKKLLANKGQGWTWNVVKLNLTPDVNGEYRMSENYLALIDNKPSYRTINGILRDVENNTSKGLDVSNLKAAVDLDYGDLPVAAQMFLSAMVSYREAVSQAFSKGERDNLLQNAFQYLADLREEEIYTCQEDGSYAYLDNSNIYDPLTIYTNMSRT